MYKTRYQRALAQLAYRRAWQNRDMDAILEPYIRTK